ncbi:probable TFIIA subunit [transcription initiation factor] [Serendipita indica DSM 11827]|uniref:Transcription initiation factor IIA subunit 2 n=1 Tax=Serendipita indica (strain DSM 11827) TaxID=1109443 RepID=G4T672_SERID|nr:probable TFIIA subunit [transcription initiation factor] [Serendipita indica DSM 11827]
MSYPYELYRGSSVGIALADSLDALISSNEITPQLAIRIMERYDKAVCDVLQKQVKAKATFKGRLHTYRNCDDVWSFYLRKCTLKMEGGEQVPVEKLKIIACKHPDAADLTKGQKTPSKNADKDKE